MGSRAQYSIYDVLYPSTGLPYHRTLDCDSMLTIAANCDFVMDHDIHQLRFAMGVPEAILYSLCLILPADPQSACCKRC